MKSKISLRVMLLTLSIASSLIGGYYVYHFILEYEAKKLLLALRPVPFSMIGRRITFNELQLIAKSMKCEANLSLYLPTWLPDGYRLSAIWVKGRNRSEWAFPIILIYSKDNYTGYSARPGVVSFEISPAGISASRLRLQIKKFNSSCDYMPIMISDDIYGIVYLHTKRPLAILYVKGLNYMVDSDNIDDLLRIIRSLKPIEQIAQD